MKDAPDSEDNTDRIDDAVLALLYLGLHSANYFSGLSRVWKSFY